MLKYYFLFPVFLLCNIVSAGNLISAPETELRIFPGNWNKRCLRDPKLSKLIRNGTDPVSGKCDGKLSDGDLRRSALAYNYHGIPEKQRTLIIEADLGRIFELDKIQLNAFRNNNLYAIKKVVFYGSRDGLTWQTLGEISDKELVLKNFLYTAAVKRKYSGIRYIRFQVVSDDTWINITEIFASGTPSDEKENSKSISKTLNIPAVSPGKIPLLFVKCRLALPEGEELGRHLLKIDFGGIKHSLLNRKNSFVDSQTGKIYPLQDQSGNFLVRADSDYTPFNAGAGKPYDDTFRLNRAFSAELANRFYSYIFRLDGNAGKVRLSAEIPAELSLDLADFVYREVPESFFFSRDWMQAVFPDTFPSSGEIDMLPGFCAAQNETALASLVLYNFTPDEGQFELAMPCGEAELFEVKNTPVEYSKKFAFENSIPGLPAGFMPEWLVPEKFELRTFFAGSHAFIIRFTPDKDCRAGDYNGIVNLRDKSGKIISSVKIRYRILPFKLPEYSDLPASFGLYIMGSGTSRMGEDFWQDITAHGITQSFMTPWGAPIKIKKDSTDNLTADFSIMNKRLEEMQKRGLNRKMLFFGTSEPLIAQLKRITGKNPGDADFDRRFREFITLFAENSRKLGIPVYLSLYDEANFKPSDWQKTIALTEIAKSVPGSRMWMTATTNGAAYYMYKKLGYQKGNDIVLTHPSKMLEQSGEQKLNFPAKQGFVTAQEVKNFHLQGEYNDVFAYPAEGARYDFGLRSYRGDLKVFYAFAFWWGNMKKPNFSPTRRHYMTIPFPENPGEKSGTTVGWEAVRCGIDDYRYLILAEQTLALEKGKDAARRKLVELIKSDSPRPDLFTVGHYLDTRAKLIKIIEDGK